MARSPIAEFWPPTSKRARLGGEQQWPGVWHQSAASTMRSLATCRGPKEFHREELEADGTALRQRILDLATEKIHPSAYLDRSHGAEDPFDPLKGVKLNYTCRSERCYTGHMHTGCNNLACWVEGNDVYARCFSERCRQAGAYLLGQLLPSSTAQVAPAVRVNMEYLERDKLLGASMITRCLKGLAEDDDTVKLNTVVNQWVAGDFKSLNIKSRMGKLTLGKHALLACSRMNCVTLWRRHRQDHLLGTSPQGTAA